MAELTETDIREHVRERYAAARRDASVRRRGAAAARLICANFDKHGNEVFGDMLYDGRA